MSAARLSLAGKVGLLVALGVITELIGPRPALFPDFKLGGRAPRTLYAPRDIEIPKSEAQLRAEREEAAARVPPVLVYSDEAQRALQAKMDTLRASLADTGAFVLSVPATEAIRRDSLPLVFAYRRVRAAVERGVVADLGQLPSRRPGVLSIVRGQEEWEVPESLVLSAESIKEKAPQEAARLWPEDPGAQRAYAEAVAYLLTPSLEYDPVLTEARRKEAREAVSPVAERLAKGEPLVLRGEEITPEIYAKIQTLRRAVAGDARRAWGRRLLILLVFGIVFLYFWAYRREAPPWSLVLAATLGHLLVVGAAWLPALSDPYVITPYFTLLPYMVLLVASLREPEAAAWLGFLEAVLLAGFFGGDYALLVYGLALAGAGAFSLKYVDQRTRVYIALGLIFAGGALAVVIGHLSAGWRLKVLGINLLWDFVSALLAVSLLAVTLPLFERAFRLSTKFRLQELGDLDSPLLRRLATEAPGTWSHTLMVASLAEAGARAVGAHELLARVGALYHDIGKLRAPHMFIENQTGENPHDRMDPAESAKVIISHVAHGVELAEESGLPREVVRFIETHHGTTLVKYFYAKAKEKDPSVREEDFRYPGPIPQSREEAIVMLADGAEAATRAMEEPTEAKIVSMLNELFSERLREGQLAASGLSSRELEQLKKAFLPILVGATHRRVAYPHEGEGA